jgi:hypothetical protein
MNDRLCNGWPDRKAHGAQGMNQQQGKQNGAGIHKKQMLLWLSYTR